MLLSEGSSPILSSLRASSKHATKPLPGTLDSYRASLKDGDILHQPVDLNAMINEYRGLIKTEDHLTAASSTLDQVEKQLDKVAS